MSKYYRVYADVDLDAIRANCIELMSKTEPSTKALAVVKADGYNRTCGYKYYNNYIVNDGTKYMSETGGKCYSDGDVGASEAKC